METQLDLELKRLIVGTNHQRRRVGQALYHLYRTLAFWNDKGMPFLDIVRAWCVGGAAIFDAMASTLRELEVFDQDVRLRAYLAEALEQLAGDLERGDHMLVPFLRWLETRFPPLTQMMQEESSASRIYDYPLASELAQMFSLCIEGDRATVVGHLRTTAAELPP